MKIEQYLSHPDIYEYQLIRTVQIPFSPAVREACEQNACGKYDKSWLCPPAVGTPQALEARVKSYPFAAVFTCKFDLEGPRDFAGMEKGHYCTRKIVQEVADAMRENGEAFLALGNGYCSLCESCAYPSAPCRFPDRALPSMEACGIDVMRLAKDIALPCSNGESTVTFFCMILYS